MKNLLILPLLFLIACGTDSNTEDVFEPYQIGTWMITSPETAEWVGSAAKMKSAEGDTVVITTTESHSIEMEAYEGEWVFVSFTEEDLGYDGRLELTVPEVPDGLSVGGFAVTITDSGFVARFKMNIVCSMDDVVDTIEYPVMDENFDLVRFYKFEVEGFVPALRDVAPYC